MTDSIQNFIQTVQRMQWSDYLDIVVVAFLIYIVLPHLKKPGNMKIVRTVGVLVLLAWLTDVLQLHTINWILSQLLTIGLLAFVVLFQPELRHMLNHLGDFRMGQIFGFTKPVQEMDQVITQTVIACEKMSKERCGALIVFAREDDLSERIHQGVVIDGQVSAQLLRTIFFLNTELHDKAVIIQNGRLAAARCKLPEAREPKPPMLKDLGTRHDSAVGMSQAYDARVVVVSEQTGKISVAINGMLKRPLSVQQLDTLLRNELCPKQNTEKAWMERLLDWFDNLGEEGKKQ